MPGTWPVRFGKGPSEKDLHQRHLVGGLLHSASGTENRTGSNPGTALRADSTAVPGRAREFEEKHLVNQEAAEPANLKPRRSGGTSGATSRPMGDGASCRCPTVPDTRVHAGPLLAAARLGRLC